MKVTGLICSLRGLEYSAEVQRERSEVEGPDGGPSRT